MEEGEATSSEGLEMLISLISIGAVSEDGWEDEVVSLEEPSTSLTDGGKVAVFGTEKNLRMSMVGYRNNDLKKNYSHHPSFGNLNFCRQGLTMSLPILSFTKIKMS